MGPCGGPLNISSEFTYSVELFLFGNGDSCADGSGFSLVVDDQEVSVEVPESAEVAAAGFVGLEVGHGWLPVVGGGGSLSPMSLR